MEDRKQGVLIVHDGCWHFGVSDDEGFQKNAIPAKFTPYLNEIWATRREAHEEAALLRSQLHQAEAERDEARRVAREMATGENLRRNGYYRNACPFCSEIELGGQVNHRTDCPVLTVRKWGE